MKRAAPCAITAITGWLLVGSALAAPQFVPGPSARYAHSMAYDSARQVVVLFGGDGDETSPGGALGDTWEWDGASWEQQSPPSSPSPRYAGAMVYDNVRGVCVFFGGTQTPTSILAETWEFDGVNWTQANPVVSPSPRRHHNMAFDSLRQRVVLFGGWSGSGNLGDTWEWDGVTWVQRTTPSAPSPRCYAGMCYDASRAELLLFGGGSGQNGSAYGDTWVFNGSAWTQRFPAASPSPRRHPAMTWQVGSGAALMFGGWLTGTNLGDSWQWDGTNWTATAPLASPVSRHWLERSLSYDESRGECVLFGGASPGGLLGDTWTFDGTEWRPELDYVTSPVNGNRYALTPPMIWPDAEVMAQSEGGHLVTVRSQAEQNWLWQTFGTQQPLHIGYSDVAVEGQWEWASGEPTVYTNWRSGAPDNAAGNQHYASMWGNVGGQWDDDYPTSAYPSIIEIAIVAASSSTTYGVGCGTPALGFFPTANPIIGTAAGALVSNAPTSFGGVAMGFNDTFLGGLPVLPLDLTSIGMAGCELLHSNEVFGLPVTPLTASTMQFDYAIPNQSALLGAHVYLQAYCFAPGVNPLQIVASNGIDWLLGNQ